MSTPAKRIQCLDRAMDILELLARGGEMGVSEIGREMGLHVATVHNILKTLHYRRYVLNHEGRYGIGPSAARLAAHWEPVSVIPRLARPVLEEITRKTGESAVASVLFADVTMVVESTMGPSEVTIQMPHEHPSTLKYATGRVLIACSDPEIWEEHIRRHQESKVSGGGDPKSMEQWMKALRRIRKEGCVIQSGGKEDTHSVGAAVYGPDGAIVAALGASCPAFRSDRTHLGSMLDEVKQGAAAVSNKLCGPGKAKDMKGREHE